MSLSELAKSVQAIKFGLLSPEDIRKMSVVNIKAADTYDEDGVPIETGLMDRRLGTIEPGQRCQTCGNRVGQCPGTSATSSSPDRSSTLGSQSSSTSC